MRTPTLISIACALALGGCSSRSLTGDQTGAGGAGTGGFATGGSGAGGSTAQLETVCAALESQYGSALADAQSCDVGQSCTQEVNSSLRTCGSCPTFVADASKLNALQQSYDQAGCPKLLSTQRCISPPCLAPIAGVCVSSDGGRGHCSYGPGPTGTGGSSGTGGTGGSAGDAGILSCGDLVQQYAAALTAAKSCDRGAAGQCQKTVPAALWSCGASSCLAYVNDATELNAIQARWQAAACEVPVLCPAIACSTPIAGACTANDAGGASCTAVYGMP